MTGDEVRALFARGVCPGCGADLAEVAGEGINHFRGDELVFARGTTGVIVPAGRPAGTTNPSDPRVCPWNADALSALVHVGIGKVAMP